MLLGGAVPRRKLAIDDPAALGTVRYGRVGSPVVPVLTRDGFSSFEHPPTVHGTGARYKPTDGTRNCPWAVATGLPGSSCQASTRTETTRRPCLVMVARAKVSRGPAERR